MMRKYGLFLFLALYPALTSSAMADDGPPRADKAAQDSGTDIVVTANREKSMASKTPMALTAIGGGDLVKAGIANSTQLGSQVAGLSLDRSGTTGGLQITIRGISSSDLSEKGDPSVAFLLDGIYIARPEEQEVGFFDISRIEVLRGPQGTLYGRNTTAGVVNVISNAPKHKFEASLDGTVGDYNTRQLTGVINVPVSTHVALRAAVNYEHRDNYLIAGPEVKTNISPYKDNVSARLSSLFDWTGGSLVIRGDYNRIDGTPANTVPMSNLYVGGNVVGVDPTYIGGKSSQQIRTLNVPLTNQLYRRANIWGVSAELTQDLGLVTASYLGSYRWSTLRDSLPLYDEAGTDVYGFYHHQTHNQNSQELRFATNGTGPFKMQVGGYFFREKTALTQDVFGFVSPTPDTTGYAYRFGRDPSLSTSVGGFAQATYAVIPAIRLTVGARYSHDKKSREGFRGFCSTVACDLPTDQVAQQPVSASFSKVTWRAGIDADLNKRTLAYATISTGYKAGGFNDGCLATTPTCGDPVNAQILLYKPETVTSYEIGLKTRTFDNRLRLNLAAFHYDYSNMQLSQTSYLCGACILTTNAAKAKVNGVEVEAIVQPTKRNRLSVSPSWLDAHYVNYIPLDNVSFAGRPLDRAPRWSIMSNYSYTLPFKTGATLAGAVHSRFSTQYDLSSGTTASMFRQPGYTKTDIDLTYTAPDGHWYVQAFAKNLENRITVSSVLNGAVPSMQLGDPRTFGVRGSMKF